MPIHITSPLIDLQDSCDSGSGDRYTYILSLLLFGTGQTKVQFKADLEAAVSVAARGESTFDPLFFPRNQVESGVSSDCAELGLRGHIGVKEARIFLSSRATAHP